MDHDIEKILKSLHIDRKAKLLSDLRNTMLTVTTDNAEQIIKQISEMMKGRFLEQNWSENEPYYYLFKACGYEILNKHIETIDSTRYAISLFRMRNSDWNESVAHWLLSVAYRHGNFPDQAEDELKLTLGILKRLAESAKQEFNYDTIEIYYQQIEEIQEALDRLSNDRLQQSVIDDIVNTYGIFTWIIGWMEIPDNEAHHNWQDEVCSLKPSDTVHIHKQIDFSVEVLKHDREVKPLTILLADMFLAHCYTLGYFAGDQNSLSFAIRYSENAVAGFSSLNAQYNEFLSHWYLAILYQSIADDEKSNYYQQNSDVLLQWFSENLEDNDEYEQIVAIHNELHNHINNLKSQGKSEGDKPSPESKKRQNPVTRILDKAKRIVSRPTTGPDPTPLTPNHFTIEGMKLQQTKLDEKSNSDQQQSKPSQIQSVNETASVFHIIIPVDRQALERSNQESIPLDEKLYEKLKDYNLSRTSRQQTQSNLRPLNNKVIIPPYVIYGRATAGPSGQVDFEELEYANGVTSDYCIEFGDLSHNVYPTKENDKQITIVESNIYGWLKIQGQSMNMTKPWPIDDKDHVLFYKIGDLESCENKIVIASQSGLDEQPPRIMIKRLKSKKDRMGSKIYYLHSESSLAIYQIDVQITENNQLIGEVVAVAKPVR